MQIASKQSSIGGRLIALVRHQGILFAFILFLIGIALSSDTFLTTGNILTVLRQSSIIGVMALGVTFVVIVGHLDLSVGSMLSLTTVLVVNLHDKVGPGPAILITLLVAILIGCFNGVLIGFFKLNSLIITLGMLSALQGVTLLYTGGQNVIIKNPDQTWFRIFGRGFIFSIPIPVIIFLSLAIVSGLVLHRTVYGRQIFAVGGNPIASVFSGVRSSWTILSAFVLSALGTAVGAIILGSRVMGSQNTVGQGYELQVLAAIILGGTSLLGGSGSIFKTVIGVLILSFIQNGLLLLGFPYYVRWLVTWFVIIAAVWLDIASKRGRFFV